MVTLIVYKQELVAQCATLLRQSTDIPFPCPATSYVQAVAAAQAGVSVIQVNVGRIDDWYLKNPNFIRDPSVRMLLLAVSSKGGSADGPNRFWCWC